MLWLGRWRTTCTTRCWQAANVTSVPAQLPRVFEFLLWSTAGGGGSQVGRWGGRPAQTSEKILSVLFVCAAPYLSPQSG